MDERPAVRRRARRSRAVNRGLEACSDGRRLSLSDLSCAYTSTSISLSFRAFILERCLAVLLPWLVGCLASIFRSFFLIFFLIVGHYASFTFNFLSSCLGSCSLRLLDRSCLAGIFNSRGYPLHVTIEPPLVVFLRFHFSVMFSS